MLDEIIDYHRWAVYGLLAVMGLNMLIPYLLRTEMVRMVFWTRVGYFAFWAFWTMVAFGGLITWLFKLREMPPTVIAMMIVLFVLMPIEIYRAVKLKLLWLQGTDGLGFNALLLWSELILTGGVTLYALYGA